MRCIRSRGRWDEEKGALLVGELIRSQIGAMVNDVIAETRARVAAATSGWRIRLSPTRKVLTPISGSGFRNIRMQAMASTTPGIA